MMVGDMMVVIVIIGMTIIDDRRFASSYFNIQYLIKEKYLRNGIFSQCTQMKKIYHDYFSYLMDEKTMSRKMAREFWDELDDTLPYGASLQQDVPSWPWATKIVVSL